MTDHSRHGDRSPYGRADSPRTSRLRPYGAGLVLAGLLVLAGCGTNATEPSPQATASASATESAGPTATPTPTTTPGTSGSPLAPSQVPTQDVITGGQGTTTEAEAVLQLDGSRVATGTARCARAIDESTDRPTIRLLLESADREHDAEVVVTDTPDPQVVSAVVMRGDEGSWAGAEGLDGSTLHASRDGEAFTVSGSVKDPATGSKHDLELRTTCRGL